MRTCDACHGSDPKCEECGGRGESIRYRCPQSEAGDVGPLVVRTLAQWQNGVMPASGGWAQQCAKLSQLVDIAAGEKAKIDEAASKAKAPKGAKTK